MTELTSALPKRTGNDQFPARRAGVTVGGIEVGDAAGEGMYR